MDRNYVTLLAVLLTSVLVLVFAEEEQYTSKYDDIDVHAILANSKLRNQYLKCYLETGPCVTADAKYFKARFPEIIATRCKKCTDKQLQFLDAVTAWYQENEPDTWKQVIETALQELNKGKNTEED